MSSIDFLVNERDEARRRLHWHLQRLATFAATEEPLGPWFDQEMALAERARRDWADEQYHISHAEPDHGSGGGSGGDK